MEKLQFFAPFEIQYRLDVENIVADYLSRHPPQGGTNRIPTYCILDLCAGMGTVLRALQLVCNNRQCQIDYVAVEQDAFCLPGLFTRTDIFRLGHDVKTLAGRRKLPSINLIIAGVPCQSFSRANATIEAPPLGLLDTRELFNSVRLLLDRLPSHMETVQEWFGEPQLHNMSNFSPQARQRLWRLRAHLLFLWREEDEGGGVGVRSRSFARAFTSPRCSRPLGGTLLLFSFPSAAINITS
eukprot:scaffold2678_cov356-Pavlova_lutheri.AAC.2